MSGTFNHCLYSPFPGSFSQFTQNYKLFKLRSVGGVCDCTRSQTIAKAESYVIFKGNIQEPVIFFVSLEATPSAQSAEMTFALKEFPETVVSCDLATGVDLSRFTWEMWYQGEGSHAGDVKTIPPDSTAWTPTRLPKLWNELGVTWVRTRLAIPESLRGVELWLNIGAVDDNDVTFLNGNIIGRTDGWDPFRIKGIRLMIPGPFL